VTNDPFSQQPAASDHARQRQTVSGGNKVLIVLAIIAGLTMVICCGFVGLGIVAMRSYTHPADTVELTDREDTFSDDSKAFLASIREANTSDVVIRIPVDNSIDQFIDEIVEKIDRGDEIPFNVDMFIEAVDSSQYYRGSMSMLDRLTIAAWIRADAPIPETTDEYHRIIGFRRVGERLAEVDLLFYSEDNQPTSARWFLVRAENGTLGDWQVYDHACIEEGRRKSDEYASYLRGDESIADGYDQAIIDAYEISVNWNHENAKDSITELRKYESIPMLRDDRDVALLHLSYIYVQNGEEGEAIRVLKKVRQPERMWGVWPMLAQCHANLDNLDDAIEAIDKADQQAPGHPRNLWLRAVIEDRMKREQEAADLDAAALRWMPQDTSLFRSVAFNHRAKDIPVLTAAAQYTLAQRRSASAWLALVDATAANQDFASVVLQSLESDDDSPAGLKALIAGSVAWADEDFAVANKLFLVARDEAIDEEMKQFARSQHQQCRLGENEIAMLLSETDDVNSALLAMLSLAYGEEFDVESTRLIGELGSDEKVANHPLASALLAWAFAKRGEYEIALEKLDRFHQQRTPSDAPILNDDDWWIDDFVDTIVTDCLLSLDRSDEAVKRFSDDLWRLEQISDWMINRRSTKMAKAFVDHHHDDSRDEMRLQVLRLKAMLETSSGNLQESNRLHSEAVAIGKRLSEREENDWSNALVHGHVRDMVLLKASPTSVPSPSGQFYQLMISESGLIEDGDQVHAWADAAMMSTDVDAENRLNIAKSLGDYELTKGNFSRAIAAFQVANQSDGSEYLKKNLNDAQILCQLAAGDFDEARTALRDLNESVGYSSIDLSPLAIADLAAWDVTSLRSRFDGMEPSQVASWLVESPRRRFFEQHQGQPGFDELLEDYPMPIGYHQPQQQGQLFFSSNQTPACTGESIAAACTAVLGAPASAKVLKHADSDTTWVVTTAADDRVLVSIATNLLSAATSDLLGIAASPEERSPDGKRSRTSAAIAILDYQPDARKRLFDVARSLAAWPEFNRDANHCIAFSQHGRVWNLLHDKNKSLADQLKWNDRVPVNFGTLDDYLFSESDAESDSTGMKKIQHWDRLLKTATNPPAVVIVHNCGEVSERLPADLLSVSEDTGEVRVRLKASSGLSSYLRDGNTAVCQAFNLRPGP
jgi:tetratricopeptide (TPR) repeat protein